MANVLQSPFSSVVQAGFVSGAPYQHFSAEQFPLIQPIHWLTSHFAVGGWSPLQRLSGMLTAHMTRVAPHNGFTWHPHRGLEIYTWVLEGKLYHEDTTGGAGEIGAGEIQRMFSGQWIEHQELNPWDEPARVIQIWYVADPASRDIEPHYQQLRGTELPQATEGDARIFRLIGDGSPMEQHMLGRLSATQVPAGGRTMVEAPRPGEDLFLYVTDGSGATRYNNTSNALGQYDVILAAPNVGEISISAGDDELHYLSFYLPSFLSV
ncbi:MAG: pirin family protein [Anaerolineales bacterium]